MIVPPNRRQQDRRVDTRVSEPLERKGDRRGEDRRDSPRPIRSVFVRSSLVPLPVLEEAALSLQGATWKTAHPPTEEKVQVHLQLPDMANESVLDAVIQRRRDLGDGVTEIYAAFEQLDVKTELALARFIESRAQLAEVLAETK